MLKTLPFGINKDTTTNAQFPAFWLPGICAFFSFQLINIQFCILDGLASIPMHDECNKLYYQKKGVAAMTYENFCPCPPVSPIVCEPIVIVRDHYVPQIVPVIHPVQIVDKIHCVPVEHHVYEYCEVTKPVGVSGKPAKKRPTGTSRAKKRK